MLTVAKVVVIMLEIVVKDVSVAVVVVCGSCGSGGVVVVVVCGSSGSVDVAEVVATVDAVAVVYQDCIQGVSVMGRSGRVMGRSGRVGGSVAVSGRNVCRKIGGRVGKRSGKIGERSESRRRKRSVSVDGKSGRNENGGGVCGGKR